MNKYLKYMYRTYINMEFMAKERKVNDYDRTEYNIAFDYLLRSLVIRRNRVAELKVRRYGR